MARANPARTRLTAFARSDVNHRHARVPLLAANLPRSYLS